MIRRLLWLAGGAVLGWHAGIFAAFMGREPDAYEDIGYRA